MKSAIFVIALGIAVPAVAGQATVPPAATPAVVPVATPGASPSASPNLEAPPSVIPVGTHVGGAPSGYDSSGRRDPFVSLMAPKPSAGNGLGAVARPRTGLGSITVTDAVVRGITKAGTKMFAIIEAPDKQSFVAKLTDRLLDGSVKRIDSDAVVFVDADGLEVRKVLRPVGEVIR